MEYLPEISEIKKRMDDRDVNQLQLSKESGISQATISMITCCKNKNPGYKTVKKLFDTLAEHLTDGDEFGEQTKAGDVCSRDIIRIKEDASLEFANKRFNDKTVSQFPVFNEQGTLVGNLAEKSLRKAMSSEWREKKVKDIMERPPMTVDYGTSLSTVEHHLEKDPYVLVRGKSGKTIFGIITDWDIRKYERTQSRKQSKAK